MRKRLRQIALFLGIAVALVLATAAILAAMYEDEISRYALTELEGKLVSDTHIDDINLSLLAHFPKASLQCRGVLIMDTFTPSDTLLYAKKISLEFGLLDLLDGSYVVDEVNIEEARGRLLRNAEDEVNYIFWDQANSNADSTSFSFALEQVNLSDTHFEWQDARSEVNLDFRIAQASLSGVFEGETMQLTAAVDIPDALVDVSEIPWLNHARVEGEIEVDIDNATSTYVIKQSDLEIEGMELQSKGRFQQTEDVVFCVLETTGKDLSLPTLMRVLPQHTTEFLSGYEVKGKADLVFNMKGASGEDQHPEVQLEAILQSASVRQLAADVAVTDIQAELSYSYTDSDELTIHSSSGELEGNELRASGGIAHLSSPWMNIHLEGELDLHDLKEFARLDQLASCEGEATFNLNYKGALRDWAFNAEDLQRAESSGQLTLRDGELKLADARHSFEQVNGTLSLINGDATIQELTGFSGASDFKFQGVFKDLLAWVFTEEKLRIEASFSSSELDLTDWLSESNSASTEAADSYHLAFPPSLEFDLQVQVDHLVFRKFEAAGLKGLAKLKSGQLHLDPVSFNTAEGEFTGKMVASAMPSGFHISSRAWLDNMNVNSLFTEFENFGQDFLQDLHIRGKCSAQATFSALVSSSLEVDPKSIVSVIDLRIDNGELIGLQSMNSICSYLRTNKVVAPFVDIDALEERLQHIAFNTLENQIDIRNERIHFPNMEIHSSAMDITTSGTHFFDNQIDYSLGFYMRDLLVQKNETAFGEVEDDGLGNRFFLSMTGTVDNPEFGYDRLAHKAQRKQDREEEKQEFRTLLKEEFGLFKKRDAKKDAENKVSSPNGTPETTIQVTLPDAEDKEKEEKTGLKKLFGKKKGEKEDEVVPPPADDDDF